MEKLISGRNIYQAANSMFYELNKKTEILNKSIDSVIVSYLVANTDPAQGETSLFKTLTASWSRREILKLLKKYDEEKMCLVSQSSDSSEVDSINTYVTSTLTIDLFGEDGDNIGSYELKNFNQGVEWFAGYAYHRTKLKEAILSCKRFKSYSS